jgi:hypothetical protein
MLKMCEQSWQLPCRKFAGQKYDVSGFCAFEKYLRASRRFFSGVNPLICGIFDFSE